MDYKEICDNLLRALDAPDSKARAGEVAVIIEQLRTLASQQQGLCLQP